MTGLTPKSLAVAMIADHTTHDILYI